ncbi:MAG: AI-2E family transporter [Erysipelotrichaceae bacterium]|nr:AI-2E family transporter [Erysipelotrichaceae bacterium]
MKENIVTFAISGIAIVAFYFFIKEFQTVTKIITKIIAVSMPFIIGFCLTFVLTPVQKCVENKILSKINISQKRKRLISVVCSMLTLALVITLFLWLLLPQLYFSMVALGKTIVDYVTNAETNLAWLYEKLPELSPIINNLFQTSEDYVLSIVSTITTYIPIAINYSYAIISNIFNILISLIITVYMLYDRERFISQIKRVTYALFSKKSADFLCKVTNLTSRMFNQFIFGKALDSFIIGIVCLICTSLLRLPYAPLFSFIIGITNMIPVFGPFIGAIPCALILLIIDYFKAFEFVIFIIILQQIDGNIIGPRILGDSLGLPSLWVMFAIIVGGGCFGIVGMFVGVPIFSVIYLLIKEKVAKVLKEKSLEI